MCLRTTSQWSNVCQFELLDTLKLTPSFMITKDRIAASPRFSSKCLRIFQADFQDILMDLVLPIIQHIWIACSLESMTMTVSNVNLTLSSSLLNEIFSAGDITRLADFQMTSITASLITPWRTWSMRKDNIDSSISDEGKRDVEFKVQQCFTMDYFVDDDSPCLRYSLPSHKWPWLTSRL